MADNGVNVPSGMGGLTRFKEGYESKFNLKPTHIFIFIIMIIAFRIALEFFVQ